MAATIDTLTPVSQVQPDRIVAPLLLLGQLPGAKFTVHPHFPSVGHGDVERHRCPAQSHVDSKMPKHISPAGASSRLDRELF